MTVFQNVAFPLKVAGLGARSAETTARVEEALALVHLDAQASRMATQLSGGQQQRLALARALVRRPPLLLLDEPLSNLDARLREQMRLELRALQRRLGITMIYVTHDQTEALSMSDRLAVMQDGRIVQAGSPAECTVRRRARSSPSSSAAATCSRSRSRRASASPPPRRPGSSASGPSTFGYIRTTVTANPAGPRRVGDVSRRDDRVRGQHRGTPAALAHALADECGGGDTVRVEMRPEHATPL